jgi:hypothetical protein
MRNKLKQIITTLTAVTFALGLAAAAQAQVAKTPEKPVVKSSPRDPSQTVSKEAAQSSDKSATPEKPEKKGKAKKSALDDSFMRRLR